MHRFLVLFFAVFFMGCGGVMLLGTHERLDGTILEVIQAKSKKPIGPQLTVIETHVYDPEEDVSTLESRYSASGTGIVDTIVGGIAGAIPAGVSGGLGIVAAGAIRPDTTSINMQGGDVSAAAVGGVGGGAVSNSESESGSESVSNSESGSQSSSNSNSESSARVKNDNTNQQQQGQIQGQKQGQIQGQKQKAEGGKGGKGGKGGRGGRGGNGGGDDDDDD